MCLKWALGGCCVLSWLLMDFNPQVRLGSPILSDLYFICSYSHTLSCLLHISATQTTTKQNIITNLCRVCKDNVVLLYSVRTGWCFDSSEFLYLEGSHSPLCPCPDLHFCRCEDNMNKKKCCFIPLCSAHKQLPFFCGLQLNSSVT